MKETLEILKGLDEEVLNLLDSEEGITADIEKVFKFREGMYEVLVLIDRYGEASPTTPPPAVTAPPLFWFTQ